MATSRIGTTITASKHSTKRLSLLSITSFGSTTSVCAVTEDNPIVVTATVCTTSTLYPYPYPAPVPPPFTTSRASHGRRSSRPRHGAPAQSAEERGEKKKRRRGLLGFVVGRKHETVLDPALCEG